MDLYMMCVLYLADDCDVHTCVASLCNEHFHSLTQVLHTETVAMMHHTLPAGLKTNWLHNNQLSALLRFC